VPYTLIAITIISAASPSVLVSNTSFSEQQDCVTTMTAMAEGAGALFRANVQAMHGDVRIKTDSGWTLVLSGLGREIARFKCLKSVR